MAEILIGEGHNGAAISAKAGDILLIKLPESPTTGFRWNVTEADSRLLQLQSDDFVHGSGTGVGGGGLRVLRYILLAPGNSPVTLQLSRAWEPAAPRSQFRIQVSIGR